METPPHLPDPRTQMLPTSALSPITHALLDLAQTPAPPPPDQPALPPGPQSSTAHVAFRLSALLRGDESPPPPPSTAQAPESDVFSPPTRPTLALEVATAHALGIWADSFLAIPTRSTIFERLHNALTRLVVGVVLSEHVDEKPSQLAKRARVYVDAAQARRAAFRDALAARYGPLEQAASASMLVGPPYVLYAYRAARGSERVRNREVGSASLGIGGGSVLAAWKDIARGVAVVEKVALGEEGSVRGVVAGMLKQAVKERGLAPALVVLEAELDGSVCAAAGVLRAVCDSYAVRLHVEGDALEMLIAGDVTKRLMYDVGELVRYAHSIVLDIASWYGTFNTAVLFFSASGAEAEVEHQIAPFELSRAMALWFLLERVNFPRSAAVVRSLCEQSFTMTDSLYSIPHLLEIKSIGCGANVLVSYASVDAGAEIRTAVNRAMFWHFQRKYPDMQNVLSIASHENREWLLLSPTHALNDCVNSRPASERLMQEICIDLVYAARRCEVVINGKAAFISEMRRCQDVEVESFPLLDPETASSPLFFAALRITPFGEVARNGHWIRDPEMVTIVEKFTYAFASLVEARPASNFECHLQESGIGNGVPFVCIGPVLPGRSDSNRTGEAETGSNDEETIVSKCAGAAKQWNFEESAALSLALDAAESVTAMIHSTLNEEGTVTPEQEDSMEQSNEDLVFATSGDINGHHPEEQNGLVENLVEGVEQEALEAPDKEVKDEPSTEDSVENRDGARLSVLEKDGEAGVEIEPNALPDASASQQEVSVRKSSGLWGLLFGGDEAKEDDESTGSIDSYRDLEDDYFRP